jgi:hypothetical protein
MRTNAEIIGDVVRYNITILMALKKEEEFWYSWLLKNASNPTGASVLETKEVLARIDEELYEFKSLFCPII